MESKQKKGLLIKYYGGFYYIHDELKDIYECKVRGKMKKQLLSGDNVYFTPLNDKKGVIESILKRKNELDRPKISNLSLVLIILANSSPVPSLLLLDRMLMMSFYKKITPIIVLNKSDLTPSENALFIKEYYPLMDIKVLETSTKNNSGIESLQESIKDQIAVFAGPSGNGKSSLLNTLVKGLKIKTQELSRKIERGKHTTRHVELYPLGNSGYLADTPGFSLIEPPSIPSKELKNYYPDFLLYADTCKFNNCIHDKEKECGIKNAIKENKIPLVRYENYLYILNELITKERTY